ncbi:hypothetical protein MRB53_028529 [Persea americana]|uniref:Uncharacterized protein n=1 Tax=Persea americana TaxID=3435 RepID=A0ACC2KFS3_PERAE|nr:hypothetical protein MRB53_028529 [Persea americana]
MWPLGHVVQVARCQSANWPRASYVGWWSLEVRVSIEWPQVAEGASGYGLAVRSVTPAAGHGGEEKRMKTAGRWTETGLNKFQVTRVPSWAPQVGGMRMTTPNQVLT